MCGGGDLYRIIAGSQEHPCGCGPPCGLEGESPMTGPLLKRLSAVALAGSLLAAGGAIAAPAASAVQGACGPIYTYSAKNNSCSYKIQHFSITGGNTYHYGTKASKTQTSIQLVCYPNTSGYGVLNNV